jgi:hypothetical protein
VRSATPRSIPDDPDLLPEVRMLLSCQPALVNHPERIAALLGADEYGVRAVLEALEVEGEVLS